MSTLPPDMLLVVSLIIGVLVPMAALGFALVARLQRRAGRTSQLRPVGGDAAPRAPWPGVRLEGRGQIWQAPDEASVRRALIELSRAAAAGVPVLIAPRSASRQAIVEELETTPGTHWLPEDRPGSERLLDAAFAHHHGRPPLVVVEGPDALEAPAPGEAPDAVLAELLTLKPKELGVVILTTPELDTDLLPAVRLIERDGALRIQGAP